MIEVMICQLINRIRELFKKKKVKCFIQILLKVDYF